MNNTKKIISYVTAATLALSIAGVVAANNHKNPVHALGSTLEIHMYDSGKVLVRGAKVSSVSGSTINATTSFGAYGVAWSVKTTNDTKLISRFKGNISLADVKVGDYISFQGSLDTTAVQPTVNAMLVKDWSVQNNVNIERKIFQGTLQSIAGTVVPTTFVLKVGNANYTVNVPANISILNKNWLQVSLANFQVGDMIRVYGAVQANNDTTIDATVIRNISS